MGRGRPRKNKRKVKPITDTSDETLQKDIDLLSKDNDPSS